MGATHVTVTVSNPAEPERSWEGLFLVDTGAINSSVPRSALESIGLVPQGLRDYEMADGTKVRFGIGGARFDFMDDFAYATVVFAGDDTEPLLGLTTLEAVGFMVDPVDQQLRRRPALPLRYRRLVDMQIAD